MSTPSARRAGRDWRARSLVGYSTGKAIAFGRDLPFLGVNHLEGHVYANWLVEGPPPAFPALCLVVSGGHTDLILMRGHGQ